MTRPFKRNGGQTKGKAQQTGKTQAEPHNVNTRPGRTHDRLFSKVSDGAISGLASTSLDASRVQRSGVWMPARRMAFNRLVALLRGLGMANTQCTHALICYRGGLHKPTKGQTFLGDALGLRLHKYGGSRARSKGWLLRTITSAALHLEASGPVDHTN